MSFKSKMAIVKIGGLAGVSAWLFCLAPEHWLGYVRDFGTVTVDGSTIQAQMYLGHPTDNEADAFLLVKTNGMGNYLLNFDEESYREVRNGEFVRLPGGAIIWTPLNKGPWRSPSSTRLNEFCIMSDGRLIDVKF